MAQKHTYLLEHQISGTGITANLLTEGSTLLERASSAASGRAAKTLVKNGPLRVTLVALRKGATVRRHHVHGPSTLQVVRGRTRVTIPRGPIVIGAGDTVALGAAVEHTHVALSDSILLLTLVE